MKYVPGGIFTGGPFGQGGCFGNLPSTFVDNKAGPRRLRGLCGTGSGTFTDQPFCGLPPDIEGGGNGGILWNSPLADVPFEKGPMDPEVNDPALVTEPKASSWTATRVYNPNFERQARKEARSSRGRTLSYGSTRR